MLVQLGLTAMKQKPGVRPGSVALVPVGQSKLVERRPRAFPRGVVSMSGVRRQEGAISREYGVDL